MNFSEYYPEGSGDGGECDPENTDDEDCYYDYETSGMEGSGADFDDIDDDRNNPTWNDHRHKNYQDRNQDVRALSKSLFFRLQFLNFIRTESNNVQLKLILSSYRLTIQMTILCKTIRLG